MAHSTLKAIFVVAFVFVYLQTILWSTYRVEAAVIVRREIAKNVAPETQAYGVGGSSLVADIISTTTKSTKLMPQIAALNDSSELPKKTTLKLLNAPLTNTNSDEMLKTANETTATMDFVTTTETNQQPAMIAAIITTTSTTSKPNTFDFDSASTKHLKPEIFSDESSTRVSIIDEPTKVISFAKNFTVLPEKRMNLLLDDSVDIQSVAATSSSSKEAKFLNDNSTNSNQLNLPSTADVWTLAGMKHTPTPRGNDELVHAMNNSSTQPIKEKLLTDWTQIVKTGVNNALTDDENENATPTVATLELTTLPPSSNISGFYATTSTSSPMSHDVVNIEKEFHNRLLNNTLLTLTSTETSLSAMSDKTDMKTPTTTTTATPVITTTEELIKEKNFTDAPKNKEKEALDLSSERTSENSTTSAIILNTLMTTSTPPVEMMSSSSTPATGIVSATTTRNFEVRHENLTASGITEGEKAVTAAIAKIETTTSSSSNSDSANIAETNNIETTTPAGIDETSSKVVLVTNVKEAINLAEITTQPTPDIHQNSTKSNLETPTTTAATTTTTTTAKTIEIETTPTIIITSVQQKNLNSSAIANEIETENSTTTAPTTSTSKRVESQDKAGVTSVTVDSFSNSSEKSTATEEFSLVETTTKPAVTTKAALTTTTTEREAKEAEQVTKATTDLETTTLINKDFDETTENPLKTVTEKNHVSNETSTKSAIDESETRSKTSTIKSLTTSEAIETTTKTAKTETETSTSAVEMNANNAKVNSNSSSSSGTTVSNEFVTTTTTPPSTSTLKTLETATSTPSKILSVSTNTDDLYETFPETTTESSENSTSAATVSAVPSSTPNSSLPIETTTVLAAETTTPAKTIAEEMFPTVETTNSDVAETTTLLPTQHYEAAPSMPATTSTANPLILHGNIGAGVPKTTPENQETDVNVVIAISVSVIGVVALILLVAFLYLMRKRQKQTTYGQRCRPVSLDAYSLDNVSVMGSMRKRPSHRSKRSYGNAAFQDPALRHNVIQTAADLAEFVKRRTSIFQEFDDVPKVTARADEIPQGCEDKNRYANVIPLPETRVILQRRNDDDTTEYINANYVRGPSDAPNYYIACQAPLESTVQDFWRMIWEQQSRVIIQATDLYEEGKERCAEYLPPSVTLDNHTTYGDFQVTLKHREVKDKYAISTILLKNTALDNACREITHYWYKWPEIGVPTEEAPIIAMLLEARSSLKSYAIEAANELKEKTNTASSNGSAGDSENKMQTNAAAGTSNNREINGNITEKAKNIARHQGPLTIHCSPGTGRTGTIIGCDMAIRSLETTKSVDIPQIVYDIRRGRASAVQTKDQYEFIYKVANIYFMKITNVSNDN